MPGDNVELARLGYEAFASGDVQAVLDFLDPEIEWRMADDEPDARTHRGHEQLLQFWADTLDAFEEFAFEVEEVLPAGEQVVVVTRMRGRGKGSGIEVNLPESHLIDIRDGKAVRVEEYRSKEEALRAARASASP